MKNVNRVIRTGAVFIACLVAQGQVSAADCKGQAEATCKSDTACSWVAGYERKDGRKVNAFCRSKPAKKASAEVSSADAKKANTTGS